MFRINFYIYFVHKIVEFMVPDYSPFKPKVRVASVEEYVISWDDLSVQNLYTTHVLEMTTPQVLLKDVNYAIEVNF